MVASDRKKVAFDSDATMNGFPMNPASPSANPIYENLSPEKLENQKRFETELEFVQCLANPHYLASLATQGLLYQPNFIAYLKYLTYWLDVDKGFGRFIVYPHALHHLELLQESSFREALKDPELRMRLEREQYLHWRTWRVSDQPATHVLPRAKTEETDAPTPNPSRSGRRSGTARSSGARTPAGRTPRSVRTPGAVRTPGPSNLRSTPGPRSALSVSHTARDYLTDIPLPSVGDNETVIAHTEAGGVEVDHVKQEEVDGERMLVDSPVHETSAGTGVVNGKGTDVVGVPSSTSTSAITLPGAIPDGTSA